ncbi:MAG: hypothetical protein M1338_02145 [Patescibacteria group bacterium]|nr:hypothetical protein [Patescibacteria group bacterium]
MLIEQSKLRKKIQVAATDFYNLVHSNSKGWGRKSRLSDEDRSVLHSVLVMAGFGHGKLAIGSMSSNRPRVDGGQEPYLSNWHTYIKVHDKDGRTDIFATEWLDNLYNTIIEYPKMEFDETVTKEIKQCVAKQIKQARPLEPIKLTDSGDLLCEYQPQATIKYKLRLGCYRLVHAKHLRDKNELCSPVGIHVDCGGQISRIPGIDDDLLACDKCKRIRVVIQKYVKTYGDLRKFMDIELHRLTYPG